MDREATGPPLVLGANDHREVESLVDALADVGQRRVALPRLAALFAAHVAAHDQDVALQPAGQWAPGDLDRLHEARDEATWLLDAMAGLEPADPLFDVLLSELTVALNAYVEAEESGAALLAGQRVAAGPVGLPTTA